MNPALIGPNAITRLAEVLPGLVGKGPTRQLFQHAGLADYLVAPPQTMVPEGEVARLHQQLWCDVGPALAREAARRAGELTGRYLLARRIPQPVQWLLKALPAAIAARVLVMAISRHAWTFCGSGKFSARWRAGALQLVIKDNPLCRGLARDEAACDFFAATFGCLFRSLVQARATVREISCEARGDAECCFELRWGGDQPGGVARKRA